MRRRKRMLKDLDDDIRDYLERETQDNIDRGMPAEEARFAASRKFGNVRRVKEETWKVWSIEWLECLLQDFRFALRSLRKAPGHTASVVLTLALGLGSAATMLAIVDSVLLRPVAIPRPHELVMLYLNSGQTGMRGELTWSQIQDLQRNSRLFTSVAGYTTIIRPVYVIGPYEELLAVLRQDRPAPGQAQRVSPEHARPPDARPGDVTRGI